VTLIHTATGTESAPYDVSETMIPRPFNCSTRYGISAATPTSDTSTPSAGLSNLRTKKSACEWSWCSVA
jgi:hypothetical protein